MGSLKIIKSGILTSLQDSGRSGYAFYAIPPSGAMDIESAHRANNMIGNPISYPVIECTLMPPSIEFLSDTTIAITGASSLWTINGQEVNCDSIIKIQKGDILKGSPFRDCMRSYIGISGKITTSQYLDSCSYNSYLASDFLDTATIKKGDIIKWEESTNKEQNIKQYKIRQKTKSSINLKRGPEYHYLNKISQHILTKGEHYSISQQINRMGARLIGRELVCSVPHINQSVPVIPGMLQLTPFGQIIVILQDGQTTGGYPRIAYMSHSELNLFNQILIGQNVELSVQ